jgi:hypothetical protein
MTLNMRFGVSSSGGVWHTMPATEDANWRHPVRAGPPGIHDGVFFGSQAMAALAFLGSYLH